jgi:predicted nucleotidyltransferase component of viral defense system
MNPLDITKHKTNLTNILIDIYKDKVLGTALGFKGGTAAMLFYNLPRFSVDLDFDLIGKNDSKDVSEIIERMDNLLSKKYTIKDQSKKHNTLFWLVSYGEGLANIKIEISKRGNPYNHYTLKSFYGVKINVLDIGDMIAHKMVTITDRPTLANRDLFDVHFFLGTPYVNDINYDIIKHRTGKEPKTFYKDLHQYVSNIDSDSILHGLGEILEQNKKDWVKAKLKIELLGLIQRQIDLVS